jgi:hypothetical protein
MIDEKFKAFAKKNCQLPKKCASFCLMNALTGEVVVLSQSDDDTYDPNNPRELKLNADKMSRFRHKAMNRHVIGSAGKPLFAFCVLQNYPYLKDLVMDYRSVGRLNTPFFFGFDFRPKPVSSYSWKPIKNDGRDLSISFFDYLTYSINHYQISLGIAVLGGYETKDDFTRAVRAARHRTREDSGRLVVTDLSNHGGRRTLEGAYIRQSRLGGVIHMETSVIAEAYKKYFDVAIDKAREPFDYSFYEGADGKVKGVKADMAVPETVVLDLNNINVPLDYKSFLLGGRQCRWNDIKLCEAFSRIITGKATRATIIKRHEDYQPLTLKTHLKNKYGDAAANRYDDGVHDYIRTPLRRVPLRGTAYIAKGKNNPSGKNIRDVLKTINTDYLNDSRQAEFALFAKTGSLREHVLHRQLPRKTRVKNSKVFLFTMGWWDENKKMFVGNAYTGACFIQASNDQHASVFFVRDNLMQWYKYLFECGG